jgi:hypothetical protein
LPAPTNDGAVEIEHGNSTVSFESGRCAPPRDHIVGSWECLLLKDSEWFYGRRFHTRAEAMIEADESKALYLTLSGALIE